MRARLVYISGGEAFPPSEIKAAMDDIRQNLKLSADVVLFGLPVDDLAEEAHIEAPEAAAVPDHKILQFPERKRRSIIDVIENPIARGTEPTISDRPLVVEDSDDAADSDDDGESITKLFDGLPSMNEETPPPPAAVNPPAKNLADEFGEYMEKEDKASKKGKSFGRKGKSTLTNIVDLFDWAAGGIVANDDSESYDMPDFLKRP